MGITAFPYSSVIDVPTARILGRDDAGTGSAEALTNLQLFAILGTGTPSASTYLRGDGTWSAVSAGVGGSTGSADNAVLRADGTGGTTLQASSIVITDNFTASPNATVNHASIQATGATTNVSVSVVPKGNGALCLAVPDGTATGGNVRGANAIDLQTVRSAATQVAAGAQSVCIGTNCTANHSYAVAIGTTASNSAGDAGVVIGLQVTGRNASQIAIGHQSSNVSAGYSIAIGNFSTIDTLAECGVTIGNHAVAINPGQLVYSVGRFSASGDRQSSETHCHAVTTSATPTELFLVANYFGGTTSRLKIPSGKVLSALVRVVGVKSGGSETIKFLRDVTIKNVGGTTSLESAVVTIGTDINVSAATLDLSADNTNDSLKIAVTPPTGEWRWLAVVEGLEIAYAT